VTEPIEVSYQAYLMGTRIPFRYAVTLHVDDIPTGIGAYVWGKARAVAVMNEMVASGNQLLNKYGVAAQIAAEVYSKRREEAMAKVKVGDSVKLLVDIGYYKKGRVCKVVEVAEPSFYVARGVNAWDDERYPVKVIPVRAATDAATLGPKDAIALAAGEFGPLDMEVDE
jgi:hypothetical protein